jgi:hypothetical protein
MAALGVIRPGSPARQALCPAATNYEHTGTRCGGGCSESDRQHGRRAVVGEEAATGSDGTLWRSGRRFRGRRFCRWFNRSGSLSNNRHRGLGGRILCMCGRGKRERCASEHERRYGRTKGTANHGDLLIG